MAKNKKKVLISIGEVAYTKEKSASWSQYDSAVADTHLYNYGVIFLDNYGLPIDDPYVCDECYQALL